MMWIISQLNKNQEVLKNSFVIRQFLIKVASIYHTSELEIDAKISHGSIDDILVRVDKKNLNEKFVLPAICRNINIFASGSGFAIFEFLYSFSTFVDDSPEVFSLDIDTKMLQDDSILQLIVSIQHVEEETDDTQQDAIIEINLPKGFVEIISIIS